MAQDLRSQELKNPVDVAEVSYTNSGAYTLADSVSTSSNDYSKLASSLSGK